MSALSNAAENSLVDHLLGTAAYTQLVTLYLGLFTANPGESGVSGEVSGGSYARVAITNDNTNFPECSASGTPTKVNGAVFTFPTASASWGVVTHWAIYNSVVGGANVMLAHGSLATPRTVADGNTPKVRAGEISLTFSNASGGGLTNRSKRKLLDQMFGGPTYTTPAAVFIGLGTALSGETITEVSDAGYARAQAAFDAASGGVAVNSSAEEPIPGPGLVGADITITHCAVWDDATAGNLLLVGPVSTSRDLTAGDTATIADSAVTVTLS